MKALHLRGAARAAAVALGIGSTTCSSDPIGQAHAQSEHEAPASANEPVAARAIVRLPERASGTVHVEDVGSNVAVAFALNDSTSCGTGACAASADCAPTYTCNVVTKTCTVPTATCDGAHTVYQEDGSPIDCVSYGCQGSGCKTQCGSALDCASGYACTRDHVCVTDADALRADELKDFLGCTVQRSRASRPGFGLMAPLLFGLLIRRRLRRSTAAAAASHR